MKKTFLITSLLIASLAMASQTAKIADVVKAPAKFDNKVLKVTGSVKMFKAKVSKGGDPYITFDLTDGKNKIAVFAHGATAKPLKDGDKVEVEGTFATLKVLYKGTPREISFKNELDCSGKKGAKPNLKLVK